MTRFYSLSLAVIGALLSLLLTACPPTCIEGESQACACTDGADGAQVCGNGALGECQCAGGGDGDGDGDGAPPDGGVSEPDAGSPDGGTNGDGDGDGDGDPDLAAGLTLLTRLAGLWSGPITSTTIVGDFPISYMDFRGVGTRQLFSRTDLNQDNSLRLLFGVETHDGEDVFVFRNGGYFLGQLRDSRTELVAADDENGVYRFCAITPTSCEPNGGCNGIEATFTFPTVDELELYVDVCQGEHMTFVADRDVVHETPMPFPADTASTGDITTPFPDLASLDVTLTWGTPAAAGDVAIFTLSANACPLNPVQSCDIARPFIITLETGATSTTFTMEQIHPGSYFVNTLVDRDGNRFPSSGDTTSTAFNDGLALTAGSNTYDLGLNITVQ